MSKTFAFSSKNSLDIIIFFFFTLCFHHVHPYNDTSSSSDAEKSILLQLKELWLNPPIHYWSNDQSCLHYWNSSTNHCNWPEIICSNSGSVVGIIVTYTCGAMIQTIPPLICDLKNLTYIDLSHNFIPEFPTSLYNCSNLKELYLSGNFFYGSIPKNIDGLLPPQLEYIDLSNNDFKGTIPDDFGKLKWLRHLDLSSNILSGQIPTQLAALPYLIHIDLRVNHLSGPIRSAIGRSSRLTDLYLSNNKFSGKIPSEIGNISRLEVLDLSINKFFGEIPYEIGNLSRLEVLDLSDNEFSAEIPSEIGNLSRLEVLDLSINEFFGEIRYEIGNSYSLRHLNLSFNKFSGRIPSEIENLSRLEVLDLSVNKFSVEIPSEIGNLFSLRQLNLSVNKFSGKIPSKIGNLSRFEVLDLSVNEFFGEIPYGIGNSYSLRHLNLSVNKFAGRVPSQIGNLSRLEVLDLSINKFSVEIPSEIGNLFSLRHLNLSVNKFSGKIPSKIGNLSRFEVLDLSVNKFAGRVPYEIGKLSRLEVLNLSVNKLFSKIPYGIGNLSRLEVLDLSVNKFSGEISYEIGNLYSLRHLNLSVNKFSNRIPYKIGKLYRLELLDLSINMFSAEIPSEIANLSSLGYLDLSVNKFSGKIPPEIGKLSVLRYLDLSNNDFSGEIPSEISFLNLYFVNLSSNRLCGSIPENFQYSSFESCFSNISDSCTSNPLSPAILSIVAVVVLLIMAFILHFWRRCKSTWYRLDSTWKLIPFQKLDFTESTILSNLIESNLIGCGRSGNVYKVQVNSSGKHVAVKRIWINEKMDEGLEKQFLSEVQILGTIRHLNILKLMCCFSSENSKLLVYEYMENGSLDEWLHSMRSMSMLSSSSSLKNNVLEWPKRLHIAISIAQGLCYMHHCSSSPIIHRDLKSSNILLDSEFNAKIADFGLARLLGNDGAPGTMSVVAGTFGYIAPECAQTTRVNEKVDVYSYGVILLELVTGRKAHQGDENSSLAEWAWHHIQHGNPIVDALDEDIKDPNYLDEVIKVFKLGIHCTCTIPSTRPTMREVQEILHICAHPSATRENILLPVAMSSTRRQDRYFHWYLGLRFLNYSLDRSAH